MEEELLGDSLPCLRELENKVGRKTPPSLLLWMRDAAERQDAARNSDAAGDCGFAPDRDLSDKIRMLRREMSCLRSADVRILRQLVTVHDGIEAMRWLMEERDASTSHSSSLTSSLSSLVAVEGHALSVSPFRESPNRTETTSEETEDHDKLLESEPSLHAAAEHSSSDCAPPPPGSPVQDSPGPGDSRLAGAHSPAADDYNVSPYIKTNAKTITRALLRSSRIRRKVTVEDLFFPANDLEETEQKGPPSRNCSGKEKGGTSEGDTSLLGYDAQWCWVESQDDVTFL